MNNSFTILLPTETWPWHDIIRKMIEWISFEKGWAYAIVGHADFCGWSKDTMALTIFFKSTDFIPSTKSTLATDCEAKLVVKIN